MDTTDFTIIRSQHGLLGRLAPGSAPPASGRSARIRLDSGGEIEVPGDVLTPHPDGGYLLNLPPGELDRYRVSAAASAGSEQVVIPVVQETLEVEKRSVETGKVRVKKTVKQRREEVNPSLWQETAKIERIPVNRVLDRPAEIRQEGDVLIVPIMEETFVVEKRLVLKEELRITRERAETHHPVEVTLLHEEVQVERIDETGAEKKRKTA